MYNEFSIFTGIGSTLRQVVSCDEQVVGHRLEHAVNEWGDVFTGSTSMMDVIAFADHGFEDDFGMVFLCYPVYVSFDTWCRAEDADLRNFAVSSPCLRLM
jgi:hypothetical protein